MTGGKYVTKQGITWKNENGVCYRIANETTEIADLQKEKQNLHILKYLVNVLDIRFLREVNQAHVHA